MASWKKIMTADKATTWQPGQLVNINLPDRGIEGTFLVQRVTITRIANLWQYRIDYGIAQV
jgi:prophage tail gpP-like protein